MKNAKKFLSLVMALAIVLSLNAMSFAASSYGIDDVLINVYDNGILVISWEDNIDASALDPSEKPYILLADQTENIDTLPGEISVLDVIIAAFAENGVDPETQILYYYDGYPLFGDPGYAITAVFINGIWYDTWNIYTDYGNGTYSSEGEGWQGYWSHFVPFEEYLSNIAEDSASWGDIIFEYNEYDYAW